MSGLALVGYPQLRLKKSEMKRIGGWLLKTFLPKKKKY
jgi:hypothetical protein